MVQKKRGCFCLGLVVHSDSFRELRSPPSLQDNAGDLPPVGRGEDSPGHRPHWFPRRASAARKHFPLQPSSFGLNADTKLLPNARILPSVRICHQSAQGRVHGALSQAAVRSDPAPSQRELACHCPSLSLPDLPRQTGQGGTSPAGLRHTGADGTEFLSACGRASLMRLHFFPSAEVVESLPGRLGLVQRQSARRLPGLRRCLLGVTVCL